jgi:hypothetical protein
LALLAAAVTLFPALTPPGAAARTYDCRQLAGGGVRSNPWRIRAPNYRRTIVKCPGFPLGQGSPDFYIFNVPKLIDGNDSVTVRSRPTIAEPAEVSLALDDLGPFALNIRGRRFLRGPYAYRRIRLASVDALTVGPWYIRTERLRALAGAPAYRLTIDLR